MSVASLHADHELPQAFTTPAASEGEASRRLARRCRIIGIPAWPWPRCAMGPSPSAVGGEATTARAPRSCFREWYSHSSVCMRMCRVPRLTCKGMCIVLVGFMASLVSLSALKSSSMI